MSSLMVWAIALADQSAKHITEVKTGLDCSCVCPGCRAALEAVNSENPSWKRRPHFRHEKSSEQESCSDAAILTGAKTCISELTEILLPGAEITALEKTSRGEVVTHTLKIEPVIHKVTTYEFIDSTDAVLTLDDGQQVHVRLVASANNGSLKSPMPVPSIDVIIDLSDPVLRVADKDTLRKHISLSAKHRVWCKNQQWDIWVEEAVKRAKQMASERDETFQREREIQLSKQRELPSDVTHNYVWSKAIPFMSSKRERQIQITIHYYRNSGHFSSPVSELPFEQILRQAEKQRTNGIPLAHLLERWDLDFQLHGNLSPLTNVLRVAGLVEVSTYSGENLVPESERH